MSPSIQLPVGEPSWSADGKTLVFILATAQGGDNVEIHSKAADGSGDEKNLTPLGNNFHYPALTPDGKYLTYIWGEGGTDISLWMLPVAGDAKPVVAYPAAVAAIEYQRLPGLARWALGGLCLRRVRTK